MSRVGKVPIPIPVDVTVSLDQNSVKVQGKRGVLIQNYLPQVRIIVGNQQCVVERTTDSKFARALHGLYRSLIYNMIIGVSEGYSKSLFISGVGYRAELQKDYLLLNLGYSAPVEYIIPKGVQIRTEGQNKVIVEGISKERVGQTAAEIRSLRPPEPYKGKGIRYEGEHIIRKVGKAGAK